MTARARARIYRLAISAGSSLLESAFWLRDLHRESSNRIANGNCNDSVINGISRAAAEGFRIAAGISGIVLANPLAVVTLTAVVLANERAHERIACCRQRQTSEQTNPLLPPPLRAESGETRQERNARRIALESATPPGRDASLK